MKKVFQENFPVWTKDIIDNLVDFYSSIDKNPIQDFEKERQFFIDYIDESKKDISFEQMINYLIVTKNSTFLFPFIPPSLILKQLNLSYKKMWF